MHNTQICLDDDLYEQLKIRSLALELSIAELICRTLEQNFKRDTITDARKFFAQLSPLESFAAIEPEYYVRTLRSGSRLLQDYRLSDK